MTHDDLQAARAARRRKFGLAVTMGILGAAAATAGFIFGSTRTGDAATLPGVIAGMGTVFVLLGLIFGWMNRPGDDGWTASIGQGKRDRLQADRSRQLFLFPVVALIFMAVAIDATVDLLAGRGGLRDWLQVFLPVLYAWVTTAIVMGWDGQSRKHRRYLEDELTAAIRARAMTAAAVVLMAGATAALGLALANPLWGAVALIASLAAAGATAGMRFAWLDREAGRDG